MITGYFKNIIAGAAILAVIVVSQVAADKYFPKFENLPPFVLPADVIRVVDLGMDSAAASYIWLSMIQDFWANKESRYGSIETYVDVINNLDPKFSYPYAFATLVFPEFGLIDEGIAVAVRGMNALPGDWQIPYHLGIIYHVYKKDRFLAAETFDKVAGLPGTPESIRTFAFGYGTAKSVRTQSRAIWQSILDQSNDEITRARAESYLAHYDVVDFLEAAARLYFKRHGKYPHTDDELVIGGILRELPPNPFSLKFTLDSGHAISRIDY